MSVLDSFLSSIRRGTRQAAPVHESRPQENDLALQTLKRKYREYLQCEDTQEKETKLFQMVPLFNKSCTRMEESVLVEKFPEVFDFAENVSFIFVRHVTQLAQTSPSSLLEYFESDGETPSAGISLLKAIAVLSRGPDTIVNAMMSSNLSSILMRCLYLFLDLPTPASSESPSLGRGTKTSSQQRSQQRSELQKLFIRVINRLLRHAQAVDALLKFDDLSLLFCAISSPCSSYNKIWRKASAEAVMTVCKYSLSDEVISYVHKKNCISFCVRNIKNFADKQSPLEVTEILVALSCCLKDSSEFSNSLIDDFSAGEGYQFLFSFLLMLDGRGEQDAKDAQRHVVLLTSDLVYCGHKPMDIVMNDPGPFNPGFIIPAPLNSATTVRNKDAFLVLHNAFLHSTSSHLGKDIIDSIINIYKCDSANFFMLEPLHTLSSFLEALENKNEDVQISVFRLLDFVIAELNYVPTSALTSVGLLLEKFEYPRLQCLALNNILKFISHKASFKDIYREAGILILLVNALKTLTNQIKETEKEKTEQDLLSVDGLAGDAGDTYHSLNSPSLSLSNPQGQTEESIFLIIESLRATIEGSDINGRAFREAGGSICVMDMLNFKRYRRMALRLMTQLVLLDEGYVHIGKLLDILNTAKSTDVDLRIDILQTILAVFQLESSTKALFRDGCGFNYLISVLTSLYGSLGPSRGKPWGNVKKADILNLIQLVFTVLTVAMQDDPANKLFFETNIQFDSFSEPLKLLGCFAHDIEQCQSINTHLSPVKDSAQSIESEFQPLSPPAQNLPTSSFIFCAAEIFRYLRDMALGIPLSQSKPLLRLAPSSSTSPQRTAVTSSATPILSHGPSHDSGQPKKFYSGYLVHPGAVLCLMDLLPAIDYDSIIGRSLSTAPDTPTIGGSEWNEDDEVGISEGRQWCLYLQDCVVRQIYNIAGSERNQQSLCQVGLPGRLLLRCGSGLSDEAHPLHEALERTFEKLSYQSLTPADFRNFLRLGDPLCCKINDYTIEELSSIAESKEREEEVGEGLCETEEDKESPGETEEPAGQTLKDKLGQPLSLARIQSLVSMTTPRDGILYGGNKFGCSSPPFIEFDMSLDGFGCLFLPSVFPQTVSQSTQSNATTSVSTTGFGLGERPFPPSNGLTYSTWFSMCSVTPDETHPVNFLTLSQCFLTTEKSLASYPLLRMYLAIGEKKLYVSTQIPRNKRDPVIEDYIHKDDRKEKNLEVSFDVPQLCHASQGMWHHVLITVQAKGLRGKAKALVYVDGKAVGSSQKLPYIHPLPLAVGNHFLPFPSDSSPFLINAHIGTHVDNRHINPLVYRTGPSYLFDEPLQPLAVHHIFILGPNYVGSFQNPVPGSMSSSMYTESLGQQVSEERIVFGLIADRPSNHTLSELVNTYQYSGYDVSTIARELSLSDKDEVTPVTLLSNSVLHLIGPARCIGAVVCGYSGIRTFEPQPLRNLLSAVGGTSVVLGLVAMAANVDSLYAAMKAVVCIVGNNDRALKEMERTGGFKLLGMLLRDKSSLVNSNILHLTFTLVGTVDNEHESARISNVIAFKDLLADQSIWKNTSEDIQKSLCQHFYDLLTHSNDQVTNAHTMLHVKLVQELLTRLHDHSLSDHTIKSMINVINALFSHGPSDEDIRRFGQLLSSLLPRDHESETSVDLYGQETPPTPREAGGREGGEETHPQVVKQEKKSKRLIRLRNLLLDVLMSHFTTERNEFDSKFARQVVSTLGFDWFLLFLQPQVHRENVIKLLRMLVLILLSDSKLRKNFTNGDIFGGWLHGMRTVLPDYSDEIHKIILFSLSPDTRPEVSIPGPIILSRLLPYHLSSPQTFLLIIGLLLGTPVTEIPYTAPLTIDSLSSIFDISHNSKSTQRANSRLYPDAVFVLLAMIRLLLHEDKPESHNKALVVIKYLEQIYTNLPSFRNTLSTSQDFIEALAATLFPPNILMNVEEEETRGGDLDDDFVILSSPVSKDPPLKDDELATKDEETIAPSTLSKGEGGASSSNVIPALMRHDSSAVLNIIKLLRMIALDGFKTCTIQGKSGNAYDCPVLEMVLEAAPVGTTDYIKAYQTIILHAISKHLEAGNEDISVTLKEIGQFNKTSIGLGVFCNRLIDKLWQGVYSKPTDYLYSFLKKLVEQALTRPKLLPLNEIQSSFNRLILYQLSAVPDTEPEQKEFVDTLCLLSSHSHVIFDETNSDETFLRCLVYRLLALVFTEGECRQGGEYHSATDLESGASDRSSRRIRGYVPILSSSLLKSGANRLWSKMLEHKREALQGVLGIPLPLASSSSTAAIATTGATGSPSSAAGGTGPPVQLSIGNPAHTKLQNCKEFLEDRSLEKCWEDFKQQEEYIAPASDQASTKERGLLKTLLKRKTTRISGRDPRLVAEEYVCWQEPQLTVASHKFEDAMQRKYQRHLDYKIRFTSSEWARIEHELTRERGLWGPDKPSFLDKWMLDSVEGPSRMRKRLCRNYLFYEKYCYDPLLESNKGGKHQNPTSYHSPLYEARSAIFSDSSLLSHSFSSPPSHIAMTTPRARESSFSSTQQNNPLSGLDEGANRADILSSLDNDDPVARALFKMIDEPITECHQCARLTGLDSWDGLLLFGSTSFYVVEGITITKDSNVVDIESATDGYDPVIPVHVQSNLLQTGEKRTIQCTKWSYVEIREVHKRRYLLRHCAMEVFSNDGQSLFLIFHLAQRDRIYQKLFSLARPSDQEHLLLIDPEMNPESVSSFFSVITGKKSLMQKWENGEISNFTYLIHLNTLAGRSYNDLMQYPVFPWVVADYDSPVLDLSDPKTFRDFSLPMGAQTSKRLKMFIERYKYFEDPMGEVSDPYYYGTHYSSAMSVASFLVRMEPFTQHFIKLQGGHFDLADRMFHSIPEAWRSASESNMADIKELIPEFFYLPDFLTNTNQYDLGIKQNMEELGDIILPPWSKGDPLEFIRVNREALESDYVSAHLHEWIDLIFGYKQQGKDAEKAHNIFHPLFYEGTIDIDTIDDPVRRNAVISFIHNFGQMPKQLFKRPHRSRKVFTGTAIGNPTIDQSAIGNLIPQVFFKNLAQLLPSKEPIKTIRGEVGQMIVTTSDKQLLIVEKRKLLLPPNYTRYFSWGYLDHSARIASVEGDKVISVFEGLQQGRILCTAALDENVLLTAGENTIVYVWNLKSGGPKERVPSSLSLKHTLHGHTGPILCLATSSSYNIIVSGSKDRTCIIWDSNKLLFVRQLCGHQSPVTIVNINQLSGNIVSCTRNDIRLWTVNGVLLARAELTITGNFRLLCCAVSEMFEWDNDNVILTGSTDGVVRLWRLEYDRDNDRMASSASPYPTTPPSTYIDTDYPNISSPISTKAPAKLARPVAHESESSEDKLDEISDTESSSDAFRRTGSDEDLPESMDEPESNKEEEEKEEERKRGEELKKERQPSVSTEDMGISRYVEEAKQRAKVLREKTGYWRRKLVLAHTLTMHTSFQRQDNTSPAGVSCITVSKDHRRLYIGDTRGRVFSWSVTDSPGGVMEHWILDDAVSGCMRCNMEFTITERKHHCRDCGKIFCSRCSDYQIEIERLKISKKVRVCVDCHDKIKQQQQQQQFVA
ncbi:PREDICTED: WD repeat and FYVE domain-containing protein 3-like isoform X2 [Amphimedon queenslandica]|uniref:WD repeat and FYVE domain-containing protein 3 n=1 Tax=Amphimedon queenslandica TaxID=400682 RepID=A0AAN0IWP3_AMPQE|nr:PREDICTED: WD repeat and FYVE domain-containing protein 3-like isoform X2 [Amphimedon queenslandica]|eukprot:XP_019848853.1 PREDICTED: WD repeat and FYVE domain-containing protein 3-like isoform X2 [Amphimedon queenslandica]